jgi:hypothetical protein
MIESLFVLTMMWMGTLAPGRDHGELAWAVAINASNEAEAAVLTAVAFRESSLRNDAVGDGGRSVCAMQIHHGSRDLLADPIACVRRGAVMLRASRVVDPSHPIASYARGPRYESDDARRISADRMALAARLLRMVAQ